MTDAFTPQMMVMIPSDPIARARSEPVLDVLTGPGLRAIIAERTEQIDKHGYLPDADWHYEEAELAQAAKSYLDTYIDLALRPDVPRTAADVPESWPFDNLFWREPTPDQARKALVKAIALAWAELDRIDATQALLDAARPLAPFTPTENNQ